MYAEKPLLHRRQEAHIPGSLRTVSIDVTQKCNMTCEHCYADTFRHKGLVDIEVLCERIEELYQLGAFHYVLQGGEAILAPDRLEAIVRATHPEECYINVVSNGWEMTAERIRWLKELKVDKVTFSMDSGIREEHDAGRLKGSFDRVLAAIDNVLAEGLFSSISVVVTRSSLYSDGFRKALDIALEKGIRIDVQIAEPVGKWDGKTDELMRPEDSAYIKKLQTELGRLPNGLTRINRDIFCGEDDHCPAGTEFVAIASDGHFLPCNFLQYSLGNIAERGIGEMRADLIRNQWFDGSQSHCICGEDEVFIKDHITPYKDAPKPLDAYSVFGLEKNCSACKKGKT